jgi:hypothetical protein
VEVKQEDRPGKLGTLVRGGAVGAAEEERQSGVGKVDSMLRGELH